METKSVIRRAYAAFNARDIDGALALMAEDVSWPKASEGGTVLDKDAIRAYWSRQWSEFDPHVEPLEMTEPAEGKLSIRVHQVVRSLKGEVLSDSEVIHVFTMRGGLIAAMALGGDGSSSAGPSAAFVHRG